MWKRWNKPIDNQTTNSNMHMRACFDFWVWKIQYEVLIHEIVLKWFNSSMPLQSLPFFHSENKFYGSPIKTILCLAAIPILAAIGDELVHAYTFPLWPLLLKCVTDSATHFAIAFLSWSYVENSSLLEKKHLARLIFCGLLAASIDLDHFIAAGSFHLWVG